MHCTPTLCGDCSLRHYLLDSKWTVQNRHRQQVLNCCDITAELHAWHDVAAALWSSTQGRTGSDGVRRLTWSLALIRRNNTDVILLKWCSSHVLSSLDCQPCAADKGLQPYTASCNLLFELLVLRQHTCHPIASFRSRH